MKIGLRGGHSPYCKGAMGILDEQAEARQIYAELKPMLETKGHVVIDCNSNANNVNAELAEGTNKANANNCDVYYTLHMNASKDGSGNGVECWMYDASNEDMNQIADQICKNFKSKGYYNRGKKFNAGYHDLRESAMPAMIIETMFCDNAGDAGRYGSLTAKGIAQLIAEGIDKKAVSGATDVSKPRPENSIVPGAGGLKELGKVDIYSAGFTDRWWPEVKNATDWVGAGDGLPLRYLGFRVTKGSIKVRVYTEASGWLPYIIFGQSYNTNDLDNGVVGDGSPIQAVEMEYLTPEGYKYKYVKYCVSDINNTSFYPAQVDNQRGGGQDGYAGVIGVAADKLIAEIV